MKLSIREAATILGRSPRTLRAQLARGEIPGVKKGRQWVLDRRDLPLTESQRKALQGKADSVRQAVEDALPSRLADKPGKRAKSLADLEAFRLVAGLLAEIRSSNLEVVPFPLRHRLVPLLESALLALAEASQQFDRTLKMQAANRARGDLARCVGLLLVPVTPSVPLPDIGQPALSWVVALEGEVLPAVAGFARWAERLKGRT